MPDSFDPYHKWLGIPPQEQPPHHYRLLGIAVFEEDRDVIQMGVDRQMLLLRSLQGGKNSTLSQKILSEISRAKLCLLDAQAKASYDDDLRARLGRNGQAEEEATAEQATAGTLPPRPVQAPPADSQAAESKRKAVVPARPGQTALGEHDADDEEDFEEEEEFEEADEAMGAVAAAVPSAQNISSTATTSRLRHTMHRRKKTPAWLVPVILGVVMAGLIAALAFVYQSSEDSKLAANSGEDTSQAELGDDQSKLTQKDAPNTSRPPPPVPASTADDAGRASPLADESQPGDDPAFVLPQSADGGIGIDPGGAQESEPAQDGIFLDEILETGFDVAANAKLGKYGTTGYPRGMPQRCRFRGVLADHALSMLPPSNGTSHASYQLDGNFHQLSATAGVLDEVEKAQTKSAVIFRVVGDEKVLWESPSMVSTDDGQDCQVPLTGVRVLRLEVECPGAADVAWAAWINPHLSLAARPLASPMTAGAAAAATAPDTAELSRAKTQIIREFKDLVARAKSPDSKLALSDKALEEASETDDAAERFGLLELAGNLAARAGDAEAALKAVEQLVRHFEVDSLQMKTSLLVTVGQNSVGPERDMALARCALALTDAAIAAEDFDAAERLISIATSAGRKARELEFVKDLIARGKEVDAIAAEHARSLRALEAVENNPDDADLNTTAGKYLCLVRGDWVKGLPMLANGSHQGLRELAGKDIAGTSHVDGRIAVGDGWWELAQEMEQLSRKQLELRAAQWYRLALVGLTGAAKTELEARLAEIDEKYRSPDPEPLAANEPAAAPEEPAPAKKVHPVLRYALQPHPQDAVAFGGHYYKLFPRKTTWRDAQRQCQQLGGYLVCVESEAEAKFIASQTKSKKKKDKLNIDGEDAWKRVWLGGVRAANGQWRWINGERAAFADWGPSQPDNALGGENRLQAGDEGRWHDAPEDAGNNGGFICEWEL